MEMTGRYVSMGQVLHKDTWSRLLTYYVLYHLRSTPSLRVEIHRRVIFLYREIATDWGGYASEQAIGFRGRFSSYRISSNASIFC